MKSKEENDLMLASNEQGMYCNACSECVPQCKKELPIPELMRAYMYTYGYREVKKAKDLLVQLDMPVDFIVQCSTKVKNPVSGLDPDSGSCYKTANFLAEFKVPLVPLTESATAVRV